ncbi:hypothetical protein [Pseudidiomarina insulisalsae]|uniref:DUF805 domain-containing protein n=1 Tax=Pseudidiomarina insulisalsae TaxID=575789 RepID=A0A432YMC3_9GAMM|nr:hypothetical protein [Pseudidiomarina insulisalsae]RUO62072.1 hypothetical protein CWI71_04270 [Pseudidiomarina insulisalsae]
MGQETFAGLGFFWMLIVGAIVVIPVWRICQRIGYPGPLSLLMLIPLANLALLYFIAFARWNPERGR